MVAPDGVPKVKRRVVHFDSVGGSTFASTTTKLFMKLIGLFCVSGQDLSHSHSTCLLEYFDFGKNDQHVNFMRHLGHVIGSSYFE